MRYYENCQKTITEAQADQSMNETMIDLLQKNRGDRRVTKKSRGKHVEVCVIVNTEPVGNHVSDSSSEEENVDDGTMWKICPVKWIDLTKNGGIWVQCNICDDYICPNCYRANDVKEDEDFYCSICSN